MQHRKQFFGGVGAAEALSASDAPEFELAGITVEAKRPDWESKLSPGTVTVIRPEEYKGEQKDLPDLLKMVPGVHVREVNGKGQYTVVSVRGSTAAQVGVFVDGVMTNLGGDAAVDISTIPVKNVERIEVYRGYIPARFGGTFIGGVINVVTKKPTKANISAELGKASFGGKSASLEVVSPLASGSLLVGLNYEAAKGDFPYKNYAYNEENQQNIQSSVTFKQKEVDELKSSLDINNWNRKNIESLYNDDEIPKNVRDQYIDSSGQVDSGAWLDFVRSGGLIQAEIEYAKEKARVTSGISQEWNTTIETYVNTKDFLEKAGNWYIAANKKDSSFSNSNFIKHYKTYMRKIEQAKKDFGDDPDAFKKKEQELLGRYGGTLKSDILGLVKLSWNNRDDPNDYFRNDPTAKKQIDDIIYAEVDKKTNTEIEKIKNAYTPDRLKDRFDPSGENYKKKENDLKVSQRDLKEYQELEKAKAERHRKYNDRKNVSSLIKWQNDNWMVKASYNHINRHLPDPLWGGEKVAGNAHTVGLPADVYDAFWADSKKCLF
uniref:TonB-dependent receptor n=1 Tax=Dialister sp. TaxID=1955814 RepID=UPI004024F8E7